MTEIGSEYIPMKKYARVRQADKLQDAVIFIILT
jgi:hypothetical protein